VCSPQISPAWTDLSGFSRLHSLSLIDYPYAGHIVNSPMVCLPRCLRRLDITDLPNFQVRLRLMLPCYAYIPSTSGSAHSCSAIMLLARAGLYREWLPHSTWSVSIDWNQRGGRCAAHTTLLVLQCRSLQGCTELEDLSLLFGFASKDGVFYDLDGLPDSVRTVSIRAPSARVKVRFLTVRNNSICPESRSPGCDPGIWNMNLPLRGCRSALRRPMAALWPRHPQACTSNA